jgi:hypothetical protein
MDPFDFEESSAGEPPLLANVNGGYGQSFAYHLTDDELMQFRQAI